MKKSTGKKAGIGGVFVVALGMLMGFGACRGHGNGFMTPERIRTVIDWKTADFMDKIDATSQQRERIEALKDRLIQEAVTLHMQLHSNHGLFLEEWKSAAPDVERIHAELDGHARLKKAFARKVADAVIELHGILTPEQRELLTERIEELHRHHRFLNSE